MFFIQKLKRGIPQRIITFGTSLTAGGAWVGLLREQLEKLFPGMTELINSGMGGKWSQWAVENISEKVLSLKPDVLFIEFAMNDAFLEYRTGIKAARLNLEYIIERTAADFPECEFILMTMNPPLDIHLERRPDVDKYFQLYREVAETRGLTLIDHHLRWKQLLDTDKKHFLELVPDGIHPSPDGSREITFDNINRLIEKAMTESKTYKSISQE
ncbi:MAG: hypothetical protein A2017_05355 [Lentisphaerae bacterium GWF2_44_16]|nr:MAG: hypothetical protein A2017_05355 [Lentisphaerae bacterium GWF2_44_16]